MFQTLRFVLLSHLLSTAGTVMNTFNIEALTPTNCSSIYSSGAADVAIRLAVSSVNEDPGFLPSGFVFALRVHEVECSPHEELVSFADLAHDRDLDAVFGPVHWGTCDPAARLAAALNLPVTSWSCTDTRLSDRTLFPTFARMSVKDGDVADALRDLLLHFKWKHAAIVARDNPQWTVLAKEVELSLRAGGLSVQHFLTVSDGASQSEITGELQRISSSVKAIILLMPSAALGSEDQNEVLLAAASLRMTTGKYAFFLVSTLFGVSLASSDWFHPDRTGSEQLKAAYESAFVLTVQPAGLDVTYSEQMERFEMALGKEPFLSEVKGSHVSALFGYVYDSVYLYARAVNSSWQGDKPSPTTVVSAMHNTTFDGLSGTVQLDQFGARLFDFVLLDYWHSSKSFGPVKRIWRHQSNPLDPYTVTNFTGSSIVWPQGSVLGPDPLCVLEETDCSVDGTAPVVSTVLAIVGGVLIVGLLTTVAAVLFVFIRRKKLKTEMATGLNKVLLTEGDLMFERVSGEFGSTRGIPDSRKTPGSQLTLKDRSIHSSSHRRESVQIKSDKAKRIKVARYNGELVFVKKIERSSFEIKSSLLRQVKMVRDLRHENLNPFMGVYSEPGDSFWIFEYCVRRSLNDIYLNENLKLDWTFKSSLLVDLVSGMRYIHNSPLKQHGRLTSHNCVIDSRWVLKVTDYGIPAMMITQGPEEEAVRRPEDLLWTAPELLRDPNLRKTGTAQGDRYSFAIILSEMLTRAEPFSMLRLTAKEIIAKLIKPPPLCRPSVSQKDAPREVIEIMKQSWCEMPDTRLDFDFIYQEFKKLNRGRRANIVDSMFKMLEKYSNHLEDLIRERTAELDEERAKTEMLLNRMLPPSVAVELKAGRSVPPVSFNCVTIFFSDIVGFTNISAQSTPFQIVTFLNDLYTAFDDTLTEHDVYKVETIGDAYMVASGLPLTNGNRHAGEIANLALDLLHVAGFKLKIRHMPETPLRLRIGIHTGQCAAGVVGLTMPRYCLFGDTVNTASRMESNGMPYRIHINQSTIDILDELGGYHVELRGEVFLKGKGVARTFWLTGRDGFTKELPDWESALEGGIIIPATPAVPECVSSQVTVAATSELTSDAPDDALRGSHLRHGSAGSLASLLTVPEGMFESNALDIEPDDNSSVSIDEGVLPSDVIAAAFYSPPSVKRRMDHFTGSRPNSAASLANLGSRPSSRSGSVAWSLADPSSRPSSRLSNHFSSRPSSRPSSRAATPASKYKSVDQPVGGVHIVITGSDVPSRAVTCVTLCEN